MGCEVYANGNEIACKAGDGKVIAAFPDVCLSPPSPPVGPIPIPYPNTSFSKDMMNGSKTVQIKGQEVMLKDQSFYKSSPLGDEAATNGLGAGVVTHVITGKTYFAAWSMDVQIEGQNVDRNLDLTTSNHASQPPNEGVPIPNMSMVAVAVPDPAPPVVPKCPCCGKTPPHDNQVNPANGQMYQPVNEMDWYKKAVDAADEKAAGIAPYCQANPAFAASDKGKIAISSTLEVQTNSRAAYARLQVARAKTPPCENLHNPADSGCGTHLKKTNSKPSTSKPADRSKLGFNDTVRMESINRARNAGKTVRSSSEVCHRTPLAAGGCPTSQDNLVPKDALTPECQQVDDDQTYLQSRAAEAWTK